MFLSQRSHPNRAVQRRRESEQQRETLQRNISQQSRLTAIARWEVKNPIIAEKSMTKRLVSQIKQSEQKDLEYRRRQ